jgi:DNA-damage-inducible protein J
MTQEARISSRINADLKREADAILAEIGMKPSQAITLFYTQIVRQRGIPLSLKVPNVALEDAMREARDPSFKKTARRYASVDAFMSDLDS